MRKLVYLSILFVALIVTCSAANATWLGWPFYTHCGIEGTATCFGFCDPGFTYDPNNISICTEAGGEGQPAVLGICDFGFTLNPNNLIYCTEAGGEGQPHVLGICDFGYTINPASPLYCTEAGGEGQPAVLGICDPGFTLDPDHLLYCTEAGGEGQPAVLGICDPGFALNPTNLLYCTEAGGEGQPTLLGFCDPGFGIDPDDIRYCTSCGDGDQPQCLKLCPSGYTVDPANLLACTLCGSLGEPPCVDLTATDPLCDPWLTPTIPNLLVSPPVYSECVEGCGDRDELPCEPLKPWVPNCMDGLEVYINGTCQPCGDSYGPACTEVGVDSCNEFNTPISGVADLLDVDLTGIFNAIDFLDVVPDICVPCGGTALPVCRVGPPCRENHREYLGFCQPTGYTAEPQTDTIGVEPQRQAQNKALWGWVDVHEHQFGNEAYGGAVLWGKPFDPEGGANSALAWCDYTNDFVTVFPNYLEILPVNELYSEFDQFTYVNNLINGFDKWAMALLTDIDGRGYPVHGSHKGRIPTQWAFGSTVNVSTNLLHFPDPTDEDFNLLDPVHLENLKIVHDVTGVKSDPFKVPQQFVDLLPFPDFIEDIFQNDDYVSHERGTWPNYEDGGHQQMYYKWLKRAYEGGMRLLVNIPVNNEVLCELSMRREGYSCNDMESAYYQVEKIKELEAFIAQYDGGWYRIAYSPEEARQIVEGGDLAVVISFEVDSLFDCKPGTDCSEQYILEEVDKLYEAGVRHIFPVHIFDNEFSGAAYYSDFFSVANTFATWDQFQPYDCSDEGFTFKFGISEPEEGGIWNMGIKLDTFVPFMAMLGDQTWDSFLTKDELFDYVYEHVTPNRKADCNSKGLSSKGEFLLNALMDKGMLIDIDHFSHRALEGFDKLRFVEDPLAGGDLQVEEVWVKGVLEILEERGYPPVSSHTMVLPDYNEYQEEDYFYEGFYDDMAEELGRTEFGYTKSQIKRIAKMGGLIAINPSRGAGNKENGTEAGTTKQFVHGLHRNMTFPEGDYYPVGATLAEGERFQSIRILGYNDIIALLRDAYDENNEFLTEDDPEWLDRDYLRIGYAGDFGAFVVQPAPRFIKSGDNYHSLCSPNELPIDDTSPELPLMADVVAHRLSICSEYLPGDNAPLNYPFEGFEPVDKASPDGPTIGQFDRQVTGQRTFDFNTQGIAHVGLIPDMLADARDNYGADLNPFFKSAEAFVQLWESVWDKDNDGVAGKNDNCPETANADQADADGDGVGDACDLCADDAENDADSDGICGDVDLCPYDAENDADGDGLCGDVDLCPYDADNDADADGVCGDLDNCPATANADQTDSDGDTSGDACDICPLDADNDADADGVCGDLDNCPATANADQTNSDGDSSGDACDICPLDADNDADADGVCGDVDNCPSIANAGQLNFDGDDQGDACDEDDDNDLILDIHDLCPFEDATGMDANRDGCIDTISGLADLLTTLVEGGVIDANQSNSLLSKVENVQKSASKENICAAIGLLEAFKNQVEAQQGKKISDEAAEMLLQYADNLVGNFYGSLSEGENCN